MSGMYIFIFASCEPFGALTTVKNDKVGETGDESYTGELLQSSVCQTGIREDSLTNINL